MGIRSTICRLVDWDIAQPKPGRLALLIGIAPWIALSLLNGQSEKASISAFYSAIIFDVFWFGFTGWRGWLIFRRTAIREDRRYDRIGKYLLPPEYANTESATKARERARLKQ